ncbi:MAG: Asp23/Gls24 family envelope stress response protein [Clostridium sp.]|uniref:Asp23/Gls24 family envelope stress response protein n=1 Tax=Clostridium sp. TaxID=1506 RepID=UPI003070E1AC
MEENILSEVPTAEEAGIVRISDEVIGVIAGLAATEIEGVAGMSAGLVEDISKKFTGKKAGSKGVKVTMDNGSAVIDLHMAVEYGIKIPEMSMKVQNNVKSTVETMTGLNVALVNIYVQNVIFPKVDKDEEIE